MCSLSTIETIWEGINKQQEQSFKHKMDMPLLLAHGFSTIINNPITLSERIGLQNMTPMCFWHCL